MASLINPHWEAITPATQQAYYKVANIDFIGRYYLAEGTGLALYLGHRFSIDLDFFSTESDAVSPGERAVFRQTFNDPSLEIIFDKDTTFVANWRGVGLSFFRLSLYPLVQSPLMLEGVPVATVEEIGAMKLAAVIDRGTRKDMVDLYYILLQTPIEKLFEVAAVKYANVRTFAISATRALAYSVDAEALPMPQMLDRTPWSKMKQFLEKQALNAGRKHLEDFWE